MFKTVLLGACALVLGAGPMLAQGAPSPDEEPQVRRAKHAEDRSDRPAGMLRVVIPAKSSSDAAVPDAENPVPPPEENPALPDLEEIPEPEPEVPDDPPTFFGEPVAGNFIWVLDRSGSMGARDQGSGPIEDQNGNTISNPNRIQVVKAECIKVLTQLTEDNQFAIVTFASSVQHFQALVVGTEGNKNDAISMISSMYPSGATAAHDALMRACQNYGVDIDKLYFLCDGGPNVTGSASQILQNFPTWYQGKRDNGCDLVCVHIGNSGYAAQFMQSLASQNGGTYVHK